MKYIFNNPFTKLGNNRLMVIYLRVPRSDQQHEYHSQNQSVCKFLIQKTRPRTTSILSQHSPADCNIICHSAISSCFLILKLVIPVL